MLQICKVWELWENSCSYNCWYILAGKKCFNKKCVWPKLRVFVTYSLFLWTFVTFLITSYYVMSVMLLRGGSQKLIKLLYLQFLLYKKTDMHNHFIFNLIPAIKRFFVYLYVLLVFFIYKIRYIKKKKHISVQEKSVWSSILAFSFIRRHFPVLFFH